MAMQQTAAGGERDEVREERGEDQRSREKLLWGKRKMC